MVKMHGKVVIVTGAASGMGAAAALEFLKQGAKVVMADRDEPKLQCTCEEFKEKTGGEAVTVVSDVSKDEDNKRIVETAMSTYGALHMSFINAGIVVQQSLLDVTEEAIDSMYGTNVKGVILGLKHQLPAISKTWDKGSIVINTSFTATTVSCTLAQACVYTSSKAAAAMMMKYGAVVGAEMKVRVNAIAPGVVKTPMVASMSDEELEGLWDQAHLAGTPIYPNDIVPVVMFLLSEDARAVTGSIYHVDCGASVK